MTEPATPRRAYYRGQNLPTIPRLTQRSIFMREEQQMLAERGAAKEGLATASYVRIAVERYLAQPYRVQAPTRLTPKYATRVTFRSNQELWDAMGFRAEQEETTRSGIVAAALILADNDGIPPATPGRVTKL